MWVHVDLVAVKCVQDKQRCSTVRLSNTLSDYGLCVNVFHLEFICSKAHIACLIALIVTVDEAMSQSLKSQGTFIYRLIYTLKYRKGDL